MKIWLWKLSRRNITRCVNCHFHFHCFSAHFRLNVLWLSKLSVFKVFFLKFWKKYFIWHSVLLVILKQNRLICLLVCPILYFISNRKLKWQGFEMPRNHESFLKYTKSGSLERGPYFWVFFFFHYLSATTVLKTLIRSRTVLCHYLPLYLSSLSYFYKDSLTQNLSAP